MSMKMKKYSRKFYKKPNETYWEWSDSVDTIKGDLPRGEHIEKGRDDNGYYYRYVYETEDSDMEDQ